MATAPGNNNPEPGATHRDEDCDPLLEQFAYLTIGNRTPYDGIEPTRSSDSPSPVALPASLPTSTTSDTNTNNSTPRSPSEAHQNEMSSPPGPKPFTATVFDTTELLELILSFMPTRDILDARTVCRKWDSIIDQSPCLRFHLFKSAQWLRHGSRFKLLPLVYPGFAVTAGESIHMGQWISVTFSPEAARDLTGEYHIQSPRSMNGNWPISEYPDFLITQPPILGMQGYLVWPPTTEGDASEDSEDDQQHAHVKLHCHEGMTVGFLAHQADSIFHETNGTSSNDRPAMIKFTGILSFVEPKIPKQASRILVTGVNAWRGSVIPLGDY